MLKYFVLVDYETEGGNFKTADFMLPNDTAESARTWARFSVFMDKRRRVARIINIEARLLR